MSEMILGNLICVDMDVRNLGFAMRTYQIREIVCRNNNNV